MGTPMNGGGPNRPKITNASVYRRNGKTLPRDKKLAVPSLSRDNAGAINLGFGKGS